MILAPSVNVGNKGGGVGHTEMEGRLEVEFGHVNSEILGGQQNMVAS